MTSTELQSHSHDSTGWERGPSTSSGVRWDATTLGARLGTDVFGTRAPGVRLES